MSGPDQMEPKLSGPEIPVIDPTKNVLQLVEAANKRQDDLREQESKHIRELLNLRSTFLDEIRRAEAARLDAIRSVDVSAVSRAAEVSAQQATTLAAQVASSADALRVALAAALEPIQKDIQDLRRAQYEAQGVKSNVGDTRLNIGALVGGIALLVSIMALVVLLTK
jgi:hypothetical protein